MKDLKDLTKEEYEKLQEVGMLKILYPDATGTYIMDTDFSLADWVLTKGYRPYNIGDWIVTDSIIPIGRIDDYIDDFHITIRSARGDGTMVTTDTVRKASNSEIESHLIEEAKRRGYKHGVKIKEINDAYHWTITDLHHDYYYNPKDNSLRTKMLGFLRLKEVAIYNNGIWAKIIKEEPIKIGGYEAKIEKGTINIGCKTFGNYKIKALRDVAEACKLYGLNMNIDGHGNINIMHTLDMNGNFKTDYYELNQVINKMVD